MPFNPTYVYVLANGTARELHADERQYLETEFQGGDGAMPYIKASYEARDGWGEIQAISSGRSSRLAPRSPTPRPKIRTGR